MLDLVNREHTNPEKKDEVKPWKWILIDSLIIAALATAVNMPSAIPGVNEAWVMAKAFFGAFFLQLAIERGIKRVLRR